MREETESLFRRGKCSRGALYMCIGGQYAPNIHCRVWLPHLHHWYNTNEMINMQENAGFPWKSSSARGDREWRPGRSCVLYHYDSLYLSIAHLQIVFVLFTISLFVREYMTFMVTFVLEYTTVTLVLLHYRCWSSLLRSFVLVHRSYSCMFLYYVVHNKSQFQ